MVSVYLIDHSQAVKVKDVTSKKMTLSCDVPQGSVLGPLLLLVYTWAYFEIDHTQRKSCFC